MLLLRYRWQSSRNVFLQLPGWSLEGGGKRDPPPLINNRYGDNVLKFQFDGITFYSMLIIVCPLVKPKTTVSLSGLRGKKVIIGAEYTSDPNSDSY